MMKMSKPENVGIDGVDHIRIHINAETELGRMLSDFSSVPVVSSKWGKFKTAVGYTVFLRTGCTHPELYQNLDSFQAVNKAKREESVHNPMYNTDYKSGLTSKVINCPELFQLLVQSELPFVVYEKGNSIIVPHYTALRDRLKSNMRKATSA